MSKKIQLIKDYYDENINLYKKKTIEINPGVTVLVGCNGIGKTTLLHQIKNQLEKDDIPCIMFDNLHDGGGYSISEALFHNDIAFGATAMCSSEGEHIVMNMARLAARIGQFVKEGLDPKEKRKREFAQILNQTKDDENSDNSEIPKERWILLDAIDSGLSVDNVVDLKEYLFKTLLKHNDGNEIYIIVSANEYEMARDEQCFDVYNGKYVELKNYEEYRDLILKSRNWKCKRSKTALLNKKA